MKESTITGLHISGKTVRWAQVKVADPLVEVLRFGSQPLGGVGQAAAQAGGAGSASVPATASPATAGTDAKDAIIRIAAVPGTDVMARYWSFPKTDAARLRQMVAHRLEADLPVPIDQLVWGHRCNGEFSQDESSVHVLAQATRSDRLSRHLSTLSAAGFEVDALTTEAEAISALCRYGLRLEAMGQTQVLILADCDCWLMAAWTGGLVRWLRRIHVDASQIEQACLQCRQSLDAEPFGSDLKRILWCAVPEMAHAKERLADQLRMPVEVVAIPEHLKTADGSPVSEDCLARFGVAVGLALAEACEADKIISLVRKPQEAPSAGRQRLERLLARPWQWAGIAAAAMVLALVIHVAALSRETRRMDRLLASGDKGDTGITALEPKIRAMQRLERYRIDVEGVVAAICPQIPENMVLTSVNLSRERALTISGTSSDPKAIFSLVENLRKSSRFASVQPGRTEPGKGGAFTITAELAGVQKLTTAGERGGRWK